MPTAIKTARTIPLRTWTWQRPKKSQSLSNRRHFHTKLKAQSVAVPLSEKPAVFEKRQSWSALESVMDRRAKAGKLIAGVAAASDSDMFKAPVSALALQDQGHISFLTVCTTSGSRKSNGQEMGR
jgi:hypothetical protein